VRPSYPSYRDSGISWLGELPAHWPTVALLRKFGVVNGGTPPSGDEECWDGDIVWLTPDDLGQNMSAVISDSRRKVTERGVQASSASVSPEGSLVLSTRAPIGHLAIAGVPVATNQGCRTLLPKGETDSAYAYYSMCVFKPVLQALGKGSTFMELSSADLRMLRVPSPPMGEQKQIAAFLDRETGQIDGLIAKQRELIERLGEYRTALITRVVTKGLPPEAAGPNPAPKLKDSGVERLGQVPDNWQVRTLRQVCRLSYGDSLRSDERAEGDVQVFGSNGVVGSHDAANTHAPTIIVGRKGSFGKVNFSPEAVFAIDTTYYIDERSTETNLRWLYYVLRSASLDDVTQDSAVPGLSRDDAYARWLPVPPRSVQDEIACHLDRRVVRIAETIQNAEAQIDRLHEYRAAIISAAVTGKIDVRDTGSADAAATGAPSVASEAAA